MKNRTIVIPVRLDAGTFRRFCWFDALRLRRKWVRPAAFALILIAFAVAALLSGKAQSGLIAAVLLAVGLGLPLAYFGTFFSQVNAQAARHGLKPSRRVYTVRLDGEGVHVANDQQREPPLDVPWDDVRAAYRVRGCAYLYVSATRAFLLPDGQGDAAPAEVWAFIAERMGARARALHSPRRARGD